MTTYELFLCWIIILLLILVVGEASIIKLAATQCIVACA
jgi:hypothetical protein